MSITLPFWKRLDQWLRPASAVVPAESAEDDELAMVLAQPPALERRSAIRHPVHIETQCMLIALVKSDPWLVLIRDISSTGIGFEFPYPLATGTFVMLDLPRCSRHDTQKLVRAQVVSAREQEDGSYVIGCLMTARLTEEQVQRLT
jgi:hypothetical protein